MSFANNPKFIIVGEESHHITLAAAVAAAQAEAEHVEEVRRINAVVIIAGHARMPFDEAAGRLARLPIELLELVQPAIEHTTTDSANLVADKFREMAINARRLEIIPPREKPKTREPFYSKFLNKKRK